MSESSDAEEYTISEQLFQNLIAKGFSENAIKKSIVSGCVDESTCTQWITMHAGHAELDTALADGIVVHIKAKRFLTEEERAAKVEELKRKAKEKKIAQAAAEKEEARRRELERIQFGREAIEAERRRKELLRQQEANEIERQKKEDAVARHRIKLQLKMDKLVRGGKNEVEARGIAEQQLQEEEAAEAAKEVEREKARQAAAQAAAQTNTTPFAVALNPSLLLKQIYEEPSMDLNEAIALIKGIQQGTGPANATAVSMLKTIIGNIVKEPLNKKLRVLKTISGAFSNKILPVPDAVRVIRFCNFDIAADASGVDILICNTVVMSTLRELLTLF